MKIILGFLLIIFASCKQSKFDYFKELYQPTVNYYTHKADSFLKIKRTDSAYYYTGMEIQIRTIQLDSMLKYK